MRMRVPPCPSVVGRLSPLVLLVPLLIFGPAGSLAAQTPMVPYFGKNNIHYDTFDWHIYTTDHFEIYYYPELEQHLERVAGYAESAYQQVSSDLRHDLSFKVPLILFKTHSEFEQQNVVPARHRKASAHSPNRTAIACCCRLTIRPIGSTVSSSTSSRTSSSSTSFRSH